MQAVDGELLEVVAFEEELAERPLLQSILVMETEDLELLKTFLIVDAAR